MAELRPHYIDVDLKKNTQYNVPVVTQNDTATHFIIRVTDDGLSDPELLDAYQEITMTSQRPDGESFYLTGTRIPGTNEIEFHLGTDETAFSGSVLASLQFYLMEDASRYTSAQFRYDVKKDLTTNYTPTQREETLVEVVLKEGPGVIQEAKDAKVAVDGALVELEQDKTAAIGRLDEVTEENKTVFRQPVNTFADHSTTYPNPEHGTTVRVTSEAASYRYSDGTWVKTDEYNPTAIDQVTAQLAETATKQEVDTKVSQIVSGTPKGTYATLAALQTAFPTGTVGVYVVAADGKWYYWNDAAWTAGGVYQGTGIADGAVTPNKTTFIEASSNLFDHTQIIKGKAMAQVFNVSTLNDYVTEASSATSQIFEIATNKTFITDIVIKNVTYYSASGLRQGALVPVAVNGKYTFTIPDNMKYFRIVGWSDAAYITKGLYEGSVFPSEHKPYGNKLKSFVKVDFAQLENVDFSKAGIIGDTLNYNTAIGNNALINNLVDGVEFDNGKYNVAFGDSALRMNTTGNHNAATGYGALMNNTTGSFLTAMGEDALMNNTTGDQNTAFGNYALKATTTGSRNTVVGTLALSLNTIGSYNVAVGNHIGMQNYGVGSSSIDDTLMVFIGAMSGVDKSVNTGAFTNAIAIGAGALVDKSNKIQLGNGKITNVSTHGDYEAQDIGSGFICKSPNGTRFKITVADDGTLTTTAI